MECIKVYKNQNVFFLLLKYYLKIHQQYIKYVYSG
jgi:hypothetical protein